MHVLLACLLLGAKVNRQKAHVLNQRLLAEKEELEEQLAKGDEAVRELEDKAKKIENEKKEVEKQVSVFTIII